MRVLVVGHDVRWSEDRFAQRWTPGLLRDGQEGPLPWWLSAHRYVYDAENRLVACTHPQMAAYSPRVDLREVA